MKHLTEEELIAQVYGEAPAEQAEHLGACAECSSAFAELKSDLAEFKPIEPPHRDELYGEQMWQRISCTFPVEAPKRRWFGIGLVPLLSYAALCGVLVAGAFYAGRRFEHRNAPVTAHNDVPQPKQPIVVVVLGDHLDRSERLLVELKHVDGTNTAMMPPLRDEARKLLAANRVCKHDAEKTGDPALSSALDRLDHVLGELANQPGGLNAAAIARLQDEMDADGLLFEVRVLRSRVHSKTPGDKNHLTGGEI